ncbi:GNAT family N-acetyltransferase [Hyphococcus sp.]|uniref:GNAT family N-acetyltransferase n=1 Tax=Hyphococcus sp. TaxID=2038636 RepID=UPI003CCBA1C7
MSGDILRLRWTGAAPRLQSERLIMRGPEPDDFPAFAAMWSDRDVIRYITKDPLNEENSWFGFLRIAGHWPMMGYGYWMVIEKDTGDLVGEVGFVDFKRTLTPSLKGQPEIGWVFAAAAHGKGYATEAAKAALEWGDEHFNGARMSCIIDIDNAPSIRVAKKCGFTESARTKYKDDDIIIFHRGEKN